MKNNKITTIIVDVGGVLHASDRGFIDDLKTELKLNDSDFNKIMKIIFDELGRGTLTEAGFWNKIEKEYGTRPISNDEKLLSRSLSKSFTPHSDFIEYIKSLKKRGLQIVIFSNTIEPHVNMLQKAGIYDGFDRKFLSNETGYRKPDEESFMHILNELGLNPGEVVFVDDDIKNIEAAKKLGIHAILFKDETTTAQEIEELLTD